MDHRLLQQLHTNRKHAKASAYANREGSCEIYDDMAGGACPSPEVPYLHLNRRAEIGGRRQISVGPRAGRQSGFRGGTAGGRGGHTGTERSASNVGQAAEERETATPPDGDSEIRKWD
jgi:hypothetical protein